MLTYESTSRFLELPNGKLHYHEAGEGPVLLLLHGSGPGVSGWANYQGNLPYFAEHFRCIILDFPGYGKSAPREGDPITPCIAATIEAMDALGIEKAHVIGNSMGGQIASLIAAKHADRVERLVCIGGVGMNIFSPFPAEGLNLLSAFAEDPSEARLREWLSSMVFDPSLVTEELVASRLEQASDPVTQATMKKMYSKKSLEFMAKFRRGPKTTMSIAHLASIQAPTLLTWGRDDRVNPLDSALIPMRLVPKCELHVFPNCGHWVMIERKHEFETLVRSFLQRSA